MRKERVTKKGEREKAVAYLRSRVFPWNFIFEDVDEDAIKHFVKYAIQICEGKGIDKRSISIGGDEVKELIIKEVKEAVNDYLLFDVDDSDMTKMHGDFAVSYPFAFTQCLAHTILYRLGFEMGDVVDAKAISELLGQDVEEMRRRELFIRDLISKNEKKAMKMFGRSILDRRVITAGGEYLGHVSNIVFDVETGSVGSLIVDHQKGGAGSKKTRVPMQDMRLSMYSKNIVLKYSTYK